MKHILFTIISAVRRCVYMTLAGIDRAAGRRVNFVVLCYHSIGSSPWKFDVALEVFEKEIAYISTLFRPLSLSQLCGYLFEQKPLTPGGFVLTFDDGYESILKALPILKKYHVQPTVFVLSNKSHVDRQSLETDKKLLTIEEMKILKKSGWEIGSHSATHRMLTVRHKKYLADEVVSSKKKLEEQLGKPVRFFSYPHGKYTEAAVNMVRGARYDMAVSMDDGIIAKGISRYAIPRVGVDGSHTLAEFKTLFSPSVIAFRNIVKRSPLQYIL